MIGYFVFFGLMLTVCVDSEPWLYVNKEAGPWIAAIPFPNAQLQYKLTGADTARKVTALELELLDEGPGYHSHQTENKMYRVLEGKVQFIVNGTQFCAKPGDYLYVPRLLKQGFRVSNPKLKQKRVRVQLVFFPGTAETFLNEMTVLHLQGKDKTSEAKTVEQKYGITVYDPVAWEDLGCFRDGTD